MYALQNFAITPNGIGSVPGMPRFVISCTVGDATTGQVLFDFTGANAINFPADLPSILNTAAERRAFVEMIAHFLVMRKAAG